MDFQQSASTETQSAVLVPVPEAERVVSRHRIRLDPAAELGVPAHVTVLYPFVAPPAITATTLAVPVSAHISRVWLMCGAATPDSWRTVAEFPLAGQPTPASAKR